MEHKKVKDISAFLIIDAMEGRYGTTKKQSSSIIYMHANNSLLSIANFLQPLVHREGKTVVVEPAMKMPVTLQSSGSSSDLTYICP